MEFLGHRLLEPKGLVHKGDWHKNHQRAFGKTSSLCLQWLKLVAWVGCWRVRGLPAEMLATRRGVWGCVVGSGLRNFCKAKLRHGGCNSREHRCWSIEITAAVTWPLARIGNEKLRWLLLWLCWPQYYFHRQRFALSGSSDLNEAEEAEIETIKQHREELLEDIKVRTILFLLSA